MSKVSANMHDDIEKVLLTEEEIKEIVNRIGKQITEDYKDKNLVLVSVLKGSVVFMADLMRAIDINAQIDFMVVSSYTGTSTTSGQVKIIKDLDLDLTGLDLVIVEDILDTGKTLHSLMKILSTRNPKSIRLCTFLDKPDRRVAPVKADYIGAVVPDEFVVGYGLDYDQNYRNLPYLGVLKPHVYES